MRGLLSNRVSEVSEIEVDVRSCTCGFPLSDELTAFPLIYRSGPGVKPGVGDRRVAEGGVGN